MVEATKPRDLDLVSLLRDMIEPPPVPYALKHPEREAGPLVNGDVTIISGEGKVGKSLTALALSLSLTTSLRLGGFLVPVQSPRRILYLDAENNERLIGRRWLQLVRGAGCEETVLAWGADPPLRYVWADRVCLDDQAGFDTVRRLVDLYRPDWLIFDSFVRFTRQSLKDAEPMSALYLDRFRPLRDMVSGGVILLAHMRKRSNQSSNDLGQRVYGSVDIRNSCDSHLALERDGEGVRVTHEATRWDETFPPFLLRLEISPDGSTARLFCEGEAEDGLGAVRTWLKEVGAAGMLRKEIVRRLADSSLASDDAAADRMASRVLKRLREAREIKDRKEGNGKRIWLAAEAPSASPDPDK